MKLQRYEFRLDQFGNELGLYQDDRGSLVLLKDLVESMPSHDDLTQASRVLRFKSEQLDRVSEWLRGLAEVTNG